jgi:hypothetical protein
MAPQVGVESDRAVGIWKVSETVRAETHHLVSGSVRCLRLQGEALGQVGIHIYPG